RRATTEHRKHFLRRACIVAPRSLARSLARATTATPISMAYPCPFCFLRRGRPRASRRAKFAERTNAQDAVLPRCQIISCHPYFAAQGLLAFLSFPGKLRSWHLRAAEQKNTLRALTSSSPDLISKKRWTGNSESGAQY